MNHLICIVWIQKEVSFRIVLLLVHWIKIWNVILHSSYSNINNTIEKKENTTEVNINSTNKGNTNEVTFNNNKTLVMQQPKNVKEFFAMVGNEFKKAGHYFKEKTPNQLKQNAHIIGNGFKDMMENLKVKMSLSKKKEEDNKNVSKSQPSTQNEYYNINEIDDMNIPVIHSEVKQETKMYTNAWLN